MARTAALAGAAVALLALAAACASAQEMRYYDANTLQERFGGGETVLEDAEAATAPCACTQTGTSGPADTGLIGCRQHLLDRGDERYFCYVADPRSCPEAEFSERFPGATAVELETNVALSAL